MLKTLVLLVIIEATMAALHQRRNPQSASPTCSHGIGDSCISDNQCRCAGEGVVCNINLVCSVPSFLEEFMRRKPCWRKYKKACTVTEECGCGGKLVCEDRECVAPKDTRLLARI